MSIREVQMYAVSCDEEGCTISTGDLGDYSGWADHGYSEEDWMNHDGVIVEGPNGSLHYCENHSQRFRCVECGEVAFPIGLSTDRTCGFCRNELAKEARP